MDVDELMAHGLDSSSGEDEPEQVSTSKKKIKRKLKPTTNKEKAKSHKASLEKLKEQDPEFYKFLQQEDKDLLNFNPDDVSESGEENDDVNEGSDSDSDGDNKLHQTPSKLEVATDSEEDESDEEIETKKTVNTKQVTVKMVNGWSKQLQKAASIPVLHELVTAFKAAVVQDDPEQAARVKYKVEGSTVFNAVVRACLAYAPATFASILALPTPKDGKKPLLPSNSGRWKKVRIDIKSYIGDLMQLLSNVAEPSILNVLLKHIGQLVCYYACFPKLVRALLRKLIKTWSSAEETSRVLAFISIMRVIRMLQDQLLEFTIKNMYMAYVSNSKFTSPTTLPLITFMQRSLVEILAINVTLTYHYAFIYIRQLAIHLRNAITVRKQESFQTVYNWQYVHSMQLWARLISQLHPNETLQPLVYPLTQTIIGTIRLVPTAKYYPLRLHCVRALNMLASSTNTFIPVLPFLIEIFDQTDFNKRCKSASFKPMNFVCILKLSKTQLQEKGFRDGLIEQLYEHLLETFHIYSHTIAFPELCLPATLQLKKFSKQCKVSNYTKQIRQIVEKVEETSKVISQRRKSTAINISNVSSVVAWEERSRQEGTPLSKYYTTWSKMRSREIQKQISGKDKISFDTLPTIERRKDSGKKRKEFKGILESDSEDSESDTEERDASRFLLKDERPSKKQKINEDSSDDYSDFNEEELEILAQSASEDDDDEDVESDNENENGIDENKDQDNSADSAEDEEDVVQDFEFSSDED